MKRDFLPKNKPLRIVLQLAIAAIGLVAIVSGISQMRRGVSELSNARVEVQGCRGTSVTAVKCDFKNIGEVKASLCMNVVIVCADGRHVAPACSESMAPGDSTSSTIENFDPAVQSTSACTNIVYEKMRAEA
jgi:hypothetical protein